MPNPTPEPKPLDCTCGFPEVICRNMNGHHPSCPVYVKWLAKQVESRSAKTAEPKPLDAEPLRKLSDADLGHISRDVVMIRGFVRPDGTEFTLVPRLLEHIAAQAAELAALRQREEDREKQLEPLVEAVKGYLGCGEPRCAECEEKFEAALAALAPTQAQGDETRG